MKRLMTILMLFVATVAWAGDLPTVIPWLEVNAATTKNLNSARAGLAHWARVIDQAIITTVPGQTEAVYESMQLANLPKMTIIPGLKGWPTFGTSPSRLDECTAWREFADAASVALRVTDADLFVFEFEGAFRSHIQGRANVNVSVMGVCADMMLPDATYLLYPTITAATDPVMRHRQMRLIEALAHGLIGRVRLTDWLYNRPAAVGWRDSAKIAAWLDAIETEYAPKDAKRYHLLYTWPDASAKFWQYGPDVPPAKHWLRALELDPDGVFLIYPGARDWVHASRIMAAEYQKALAE